MSDALARTLASAGAVTENGELAHFGDPRAELEAALHACALIDHSALTRLECEGADLFALLQRLSTAEVESLEAGSGVPTVLTTSKGRIVERLFVHRPAPDRGLIVAGEGAQPRIREHLTRYTFAEQYTLHDAAQTSRLLTLVGPRAREAADRAGLPRVGPHGVVEVDSESHPTWMLGHDGLSEDGVSLWVADEGAAALWQRLAEAVGEHEGRPCGRIAAECRRVLHGLGASGRELTEAWNPLEAGLEAAVSFDKGCYVGQEVVARLRTYDKVSRGLFGLRFGPGVEPPTTPAPLRHGDREVGELTSAVRAPAPYGTVGIGYVKRRDAAPGLRVRVGTFDPPLEAELVDLPFAEVNRMPGGEQDARPVSP